MQLSGTSSKIEVKFYGDHIELHIQEKRIWGEPDNYYTIAVKYSDIDKREHYSHPKNAILGNYIFVPATGHTLTVREETNYEGGAGLDSYVEGVAVVEDIPLHIYKHMAIVNCSKLMSMFQKSSDEEQVIGIGHNKPPPEDSVWNATIFVKLTQEIQDSIESEDASRLQSLSKKLKHYMDIIADNAASGLGKAIGAGVLVLIMQLLGLLELITEMIRR